MVATFGPRACIAGAGILNAIGALAAGLASSLPIFISGRILSGIACGLLSPALTILILEYAPIKRRGLFLGLQNTGFTVSLLKVAIQY